MVFIMIFIRTYEYKAAVFSITVGYLLVILTFATCIAEISVNVGHCETHSLFKLQIYRGET